MNNSNKVITSSKDDSFFKNENEEVKSVSKPRVHHIKINSKKPPLIRIPTKDNLHPVNKDRP